METNTKAEHSCVNWFKRNHRKYDEVTGNRIPVSRYMGMVWLCVDCQDEIKINKWFLPIKQWIDEHNIEQLQDVPGQIKPDSSILWGTRFHKKKDVFN